MKGDFHARFWCARLTGERQGVQVPQSEGLTNHARSASRAQNAVKH